MNKLLETLFEHPEMVETLLPKLVDQYKTTVYAAGKEFLKIYSDLNNNEEWFALNAQYKKKVYNSYLNVGFDTDQAMALMLNDNLKLMKQLKESSKNVKSNK